MYICGPLQYSLLNNEYARVISCIAELIPVVQGLCYESQIAAFRTPIDANNLVRLRCLGLSSANDVPLSQHALFLLEPRHRV